jgi:hypothetical protein
MGLVGGLLGVEWRDGADGEERGGEEATHHGTAGVGREAGRSMVLRA